ncbi:MAG: GDSL-like Lipase/Acylhydrolase [Candidatus Krumholzibacteriota bacterium]|nr:GDSL-like Lipase/Acylhydrolase [Candidatus Krumholzibacteriota bacterium]
MLRAIRNILLVTVPTLLGLAIALEVIFRTAIPACRFPAACFDETEGLFKYCVDSGQGLASFGPFAQQKGRWRINDHGWNSAIDYEEPKTRTRVAVIGDSYVEAFQVDADKNYPALLRAALSDTCDVYGFGVSGAALSEYLHIGRYAVKRFDPDVLIFNVVHNDFLESVRELYPVHKHQMKVSVREDAVEEVAAVADPSFSQYSRMRRLVKESAAVRYLLFNLKFQNTVGAVRSRGKYAANIELDPVVKNQAVIERAVDYIVARIADENRGRRVIFVMCPPRRDIYEGTAAESPVRFLHEMLGRACAENDLEFFDLTEAMTRDYAAKRIKFFPDVDGHWNEYGHRFVADQILELAFDLRRIYLGVASGRPPSTGIVAPVVGVRRVAKKRTALATWTAVTRVLRRFRSR